MSKEWFEWYVSEATKSKKWAMYKDRYLCPCCFMPTLDERSGYEICPICFWEDDGQDSDDADIVRGGPNSNYSLTEARSDFEEFKTMYRRSDTRQFDNQEQSKVERMSLYSAFLKAIKSESGIDWIMAIKQQEDHRGE